MRSRQREPIQTTSLTGKFVQTGTGIFAVDVDSPSATADRLNVSGTATLAGQVVPTVVNFQSTHQEFMILSSAATTSAGITVVDTAVINYELLFPTTEDMVLSIDVNFVPGGGNDNQNSVGKNLNDVVNGGGLQGPIDALANLLTQAELASALNQLLPSPYLDSEIATLFSSLYFTNSLMSCPVRDGPAAFIREGECVWGRVSGRSFDQDATSQTLGFDETSFQVSGGMQAALGEVWRIGFAGAYERSSLDTDTFAESDADRLHGGAVLKFNPGPLLLAAAVSGGQGWYDTERPISFPGFSAVASADDDISYVNGRLRAAYLFGGYAWYLKPQVDFDATQISLDNVRERGADGLSLIVRGNDETVLSASPALEIGTQFSLSNGTFVRPFVRGGATFFDDPDFVVRASFEGAPSGVAPFRTSAGTDDVVANASAGVDLLATDGASLKLYYEGSFGDTVEEHSAGAKATLPF
jgi:uncharacterized protein with beta-barrel porin domain